MNKIILQTLLFLLIGFSCIATPTEDFCETSDLFGCRPPQNSRIKEVFKNKASITWDAVSSANGYKLRLRKQGSPTWEIVLNTGFTHGFTFLELDSCTTYEYVIKASCPDGESGFSDLFTFTTGGNCIITDTKLEELISFEIKVFPNPAIDQFSIKLEGNSNPSGIIQILNSEGQSVMERSVRNNKAIRFNADHLAPGIYWCQFYSEDGGAPVSKKILIQR